MTIKPNYWKLIGIAIEFASAMLVIWCLCEAWDYFHAVDDVLAIAGAR